MKEAVTKYRTVLVQRINPFIRRMQYEGTDVVSFAARVVEDYDARNFVTAGGWALEALARSVNPTIQKSAAKGIDLQRYDPGTGEYHLYVLKSGLVTRNSDIVNSLKKNSRAAQGLLRQSGSKAAVTLNYAIAAGRTSSTFEDGVRRPSSAEFWSEVMGLPPKEAVDLALAIASEAGQLIRRDASAHVKAMKVLLSVYLADKSNAQNVDWEFLKLRGFQPRAVWGPDDRRRHISALEALKKSGYSETNAVAEVGKKEDATPESELEESASETEQSAPEE